MSFLMIMIIHYCSQEVSGEDVARHFDFLTLRASPTLLEMFMPVGHVSDKCRQPSPVIIATRMYSSK